MKIVKGNLIDMALAGAFDVIAHGCNCMNTMGKGLALQIKNNFLKPTRPTARRRRATPTSWEEYPLRRLRASGDDVRHR